MSALEGKADVMSASGKVANDPTQTLRSSYYLTGNRNASVVRNDQDDAPGWALDVEVGVDRSIDWLVAEFEHTTKAAADRHRPLLAQCRQPVRGNNGRCAEEPTLL
jgi:hypothetical protein